MIRKLHYKILPAKTNQLIRDFQKKRPRFLKNFYLSGGTGLSLYFGHRESIDLDFFSPKDFDPKSIQAELEKLGQLKSLQLDENTLNAFLKGVQVQFLGYPYPLLAPTINWKGMRISSLVDIACTKLQTIGLRGNKKDFIDLYFILQKYSLKKLFEKLERKYKRVDFSKTHILKSLVFFQDAEAQPMPRMHQEVKWEEIKKKIVEKVIEFSF